MKIQSRTFVVSGGSSGLGLAAAEMLLSSGAFVANLDLAPPPDTSSLASSKQSKFIHTDIASLPSVESAVSQAADWVAETGAAFGGVLNCAGIGGPSAHIVNRRDEPFPVEVWDKVMAVNTTGTFNLTRLVLKHLVKVAPEGPDGERGVVIMVSSTAAHGADEGMVAYAASKGAIRAMTTPLSRDMASRGVRVVTIAPTIFATPLSSNFKGALRDFLEKRTTMFPARFGEAPEFAQTVKWIVECSFVNGETIKLTGGQRVIPSRASRL
ncbi:3-hydroxyacyl-CoA dehydrogenase [Cylindrobasidium torrendii FP15055 ss-10]|uniref:3-hydroxyacyl-CoA dehydrogenase n=1 Tax=Cylindrobasidium torrendii FP15055 ss-10 TaxID=1314674 RepID=A0A0D7BVR4_9AGAR|nr:3-hydroxyacyl-CoA dehydrogenase [Cylindrobasidium torrendii FP15055 ss-10]